VKHLYKIFEAMDNRNIPYCFQSHGTSKYYNLKLKDVNGKEHYFSSSSLIEIEMFALKINGKLLNNPLPKKIPLPGALRAL